MSLNVSRKGSAALAAVRAHATGRSEVRTLQSRENRPALAPEHSAAVSQLSLPGFPAAIWIQPLRKSSTATQRQVARYVAQQEDELLMLYRERLVASGTAPRGQSLYLFHVRAVLKASSNLSPKTVSWTDLMRDRLLLGRALTDDRSPSNPERQLSKWTLASRRSAVRSFIEMLRPELFDLLGEDPSIVVNVALRLVAEPVGLGFRLTGGAPRRRGGRTPTSDEIDAVLLAAADAEGFRGLRNRAFLLILAESGARVNALRCLDGAQCYSHIDGTMRLYLREKGKREPREVELSAAAAQALHAYAGEFNRLATLRGWSSRVTLGNMGPVWRNSARGTWTYNDILRTLRVACTSVDVEAFTPHALRRAFATDATAVLPRHIVAQAGGWHGLERMDNHYVHPHEHLISRKLAQSTQIPDHVKEKTDYGGSTCGPTPAISGRAGRR